VFLPEERPWHVRRPEECKRGARCSEAAGGGWGAGGQSDEGNTTYHPSVSHASNQILLLKNALHFFLCHSTTPPVGGAGGGSPEPQGPPRPPGPPGPPGPPQLWPPLAATFRSFLRICSILDLTKEFFVDNSRVRAATSSRAGHSATVRRRTALRTWKSLAALPGSPPGSLLPSRWSHMRRMIFMGPRSNTGMRGERRSTNWAQRATHRSTSARGTFRGVVSGVW
jgi:hypothetical protein